MKTFKYILSVLLAAFVIAGCTDEVEYTPGAPENDDSYGVYFPTQPGTKLELEPTAATSRTYRVKRHNTKGAIKVPVVMRASEEGIFTLSTLKFSDGQKESTLTIDFPNAEIGKAYTVDLSIEDPAYAYTYSELSTGLNLSISRVQWNVLGTGKWRDDIISSMFNVTNANAEIDVKVEERADRPGYYRVTEPYGPKMMQALFGRNVGSFVEGSNIIVNATNPDKAYIPYQTTGATLGSDGEVEIASYTPEIFSVDESAARYGKLKDGIVTFPVGGIMVNFTVSGGWYTGNGSGKTRLMLPGSREYDYSVTLTKGLPADGKVELGVEVGADIVRVAYTIFEGRLTSGQAQLKSLDMHDNQVFDGELSKSSTLTVSGRETGIYTIVTCNYDAKGTMQGYSYLPFGYVAAGDEKPVVLNVYAELTSEFAGQGHTRENSIRIGAYGEEIESGYYGLFKTEQLDQFTSAQYEAVVKANGKAFTDAQLEEINGKGWNTLLINLEGGQSYTLLVTANNGYFQKTFRVDQATEGKPSPLQTKYGPDDITPAAGKEEFIGTWDYYAVDAYDEKGNTARQYWGKVTIADYAEDPEDTDLMTIRGLSAAEKSIGGNDTQLIMYDGGIIYTISDQLVGQYQQYYIGTKFSNLEDQYVYGGNGLLVAAPVADGLIAFVGNPQIAASEGLTFVGMWFGAYKTYDPNTGKFSDSAGGLLHYQYLLLADPQEYPTPSAAAAATASLEPSNYVELRGIDRLEYLSKEYFSSRKPKHQGSEMEIDPADNAGGDRAEGIEVEVGDRKDQNIGDEPVEVTMLSGLKRLELQVIQ